MRINTDKSIKTGTEWRKRYGSWDEAKEAAAGAEKRDRHGRGHEGAEKDKGDKA